MDHLPVVLGRGQPFLEAVSSSRGNSRSVCPRGRLLALVKARGEVAVHSLARECREAVIASGCFIRSAIHRRLQPCHRLPLLCT